MNYPKSRKEAQEQGAKYYFTGVPCMRGHIAPRKTKGACLECLKMEWAANADKRKEYFTAYNHLEATKERKRRYYEKNREKVIARAFARPTEDKQRYRVTWKEKNPEKVAAHTKSRCRKHRHAIPKWLTKQERDSMRQLYLIARISSQTTGVPYVVDHIVPLRGDGVCGLHVPWNLQVITREENLAKSNKLVDTPTPA